MKAPLALSILLLAPALHAADLAGLWEFNNPANLGQATVGPNLTVVGAAPAHSLSLADSSGVTLGGVITTVGGTANRLSVAHGIPGNGGSSTYVNEWSVLFDVFSPAASRSSWRSLFQTNAGNSNNDGDYFIRNSNDTLGTADLGYTGSAINDSIWTRLVVTVNLGTTNPEDSIRAYINGSLFHTHNDLALNGRYSLDPVLLFFADDNSENASLHVGTVALFNGALSATEVSALGNSLVNVPEPSTGLLALAGTVAVGAIRRRRSGSR